MTSTAAIPIYQGQDFYVPAFEIKLAGRAPGQAVVRDIMSVTYKDSVTEIDSFDIVINNWDAEARTFKYSDDDLFDPGERIELAMGYRGAMRTMLRGEITSLRPTFPAGGGSTLSVSGLNILHRFRDEQKSHSYVDVTDSEIAKQIEARLNNVAKVRIEVPDQGKEKEPRFKFIIQDSKYDIVFLMERARQIGYDIFVQEPGPNDPPETIIKYVKSTAVPYPTYELAYGKSLVEFSPELTTANQVGQVEVRGWDAINKQKIVYIAKRSELTTKGVGKEGGQEKIDKAIEKKKEVVATKLVESEAEARRVAIEILEGIAKEMVKANGSVPGLPDIRAGTVLHIDGVGKRFSGRYFVVGTTHTIGDSGYTTGFECRREEL
jgi:phage protein D